MKDAARFERLLEAYLDGERPPDEAWDPFRDRMAILITDLSGFTRIGRQLGPEGVTALIHGMRLIALPLLHRHGGVLVKYQADDLFATFPAPEAALRCALDLQRALHQPERPLPVPVRLCMGIGYGPILWWGDNDLYGEEVNLASKLGEDTAQAGEILLTASAAEGVRASHPAVRFDDRPPLDVGGAPYTYYAYAGGF